MDRHIWCHSAYAGLAAYLTRSADFFLVFFVTTGGRLRLFLRRRTEIQGGRHSYECRPRGSLAVGSEQLDEYLPHVYRFVA